MAVERINGPFSAGEFLTGDLDYVHVFTVHEVTEGGDVTTSAQKNFDNMMRAISSVANPVIVTAPVTVASTTNPTTSALADVEGNAILSAGDFGTDLTESTANIYMWTVVIEKTRSFSGPTGGETTGTANLTALEDALDGTVVYNTSATDGINEDVAGGALAVDEAFTAVSASNASASTKQSIVLVRSDSIIFPGQFTA